MLLVQRRRAAEARPAPAAAAPIDPLAEARRADELGFTESAKAWRMAAGAE